MKNKIRNVRVNFRSTPLIFGKSLNDKGITCSGDVVSVTYVLIYYIYISHHIVGTFVVMCSYNKCFCDDVLNPFTFKLN